MKHSFVSAKTDVADGTLVRPSDWNAIHIGAVSEANSNVTLDASHDVVKATAGAGGITITLPSAVGMSGRTYFIKRVDNGAGVVTIATTLSQTIDGYTTYVLVNQWQYIEVMSDGANWMIKGNN